MRLYEIHAILDDGTPAVIEVEAESATLAQKLFRDENPYARVIEVKWTLFQR